MKRLILILYTLLTASAASAQFRYHIDNVTDYSSVRTTGNGQRRVGTRASAPLPCTGSPKVPIVLVQFADKEFSADTLLDKAIEHSDANVNAFYNKYCNGSDDPDEDYRFTIGSVGTVKGYFMNQSDDKFQPDFVVIGPVTLSKSYAYYGKDNSDYSKDVNIAEFRTETLQGATDLGVDWTQFDNNGDGTVDFVFFIYAGEGQNSYGYMSTDAEHSSLIWPHEWTTSTTVGGIKFGGYGCTNETFHGYADGRVTAGRCFCDIFTTICERFLLSFLSIEQSDGYSIH